MPERKGGSCSIDKWFSNDHDTKSLKGSAKPESTKTSGGHSGGIWGDLDCDSVPDAVLLTAADAVEQRVKEQRRPDGALHFPGRGQKLSTATNASVPPGSIVRRIPGVGLISSHSVGDLKQTTDSPTSKPALNAAATNLSQRRSLSDLSSFSGSVPECDNIVDWTALPASAVQFESVAEFRKTIGMVLSPPGTEVRVKNFVSVCSRNGRPFNSGHNKVDAPRVKPVHSLSDDDAKVAVRPVKKMRYDADDTVTGHNDCVIIVNSDSENNGTDDKKESWQNEEKPFHDETLSTAHGIPSLEASADEAVTARVDQAIGGVGTSQSRCVECPVCQMSIPANSINDHLDQCLM